MSEREAMPQVVREKRIKRRKTMFAKEGVEGVWIIGVYNTFEN